MQAKKTPQRWWIGRWGHTYRRKRPGTVEVMPVAEHEEAIAVLQAVYEAHVAGLTGDGNCAEAESVKAREITDEMRTRAIDALHAIRFCVGADSCEAESVVRIVLEAALGQKGDGQEDLGTGEQTQVSAPRVDPDPEADGPKTVLTVEVVHRRKIDLDVFLPRKEAWERREELAEPYLKDIGERLVAWYSVEEVRPALSQEEHDG